MVTASPNGSPNVFSSLPPPRQVSVPSSPGRVKYPVRATATGRRRSGSHPSSNPRPSSSASQIPHLYVVPAALTRWQSTDRYNSGRRLGTSGGCRFSHHRDPQHIIEHHPYRTPEADFMAICLRQGLPDPWCPHGSVLRLVGPVRSPCHIFQE